MGSPLFIKGFYAFDITFLYKEYWYKYALNEGGYTQEYGFALVGEGSCLKALSSANCTWDIFMPYILVNYSDSMPYLEGNYNIKNYNSGKYLDIRGAAPVHLAKVQQYDGLLPEQIWSLTYNSSGGYYTIKPNGNRSLNLDVSSPATGNHAKVQLYNAGSYEEQKWYIVKNGDGTYRFINGYDKSKCMDIMGGSKDSRADVQIFQAGQM